MVDVVAKLGTAARTPPLPLISSFAGVGSGRYILCPVVGLSLVPPLDLSSEAVRAWTRFSDVVRVAQDNLVRNALLY